MVHQMTNRPNDAPRCFGFASAFGADDDICRCCSANEQCKPLAVANLKDLSQLIDVGNVASMHFIAPENKTKPKKDENVNNEMLPADSSVVALSAQANAMIERINKCTANIHADMIAGNNPFSISDKPAYLRPITNLILCGIADDETVVKDLMSKFDLPETQAKSLFNIVKSAMTYLGVVIEKDNKLQIRR